MVQAGLKAIYVSGWQVAGDTNTAQQTYPDQSLYPVDSVPTLVRRINNALQRADQISASTRLSEQMPYWYAPILADAEAGFGGVLNAFELMKAMIEAGAAAVHFEDQLSSSKKCGHMGGKVLVPTQEAVAKLIAARLAADVLDVPTLIVGRTDAMAAGLLTSDVDSRDHEFLTGERTVEGFLRGPRRAAAGDRPRAGLRPLRRHGLVRNFHARPRRGRAVRRGDPRPLSRQAAGLQLFAVVQLEQGPDRGADRLLPAEAGGDGLQVPVRHAGGVPRPEHEHVRAGPRLPRRRDAGLLAVAAAGIRVGARVTATGP